MASMQVQTLIFSKDKFSRAQAVRWAKDHDFDHAGVDETGDSYRLRQENPSKFKTMRTITMTEGVKAVVGKSVDPAIASLSPAIVAKAFSPFVDPVDIRSQILEDNDGYLGGTIRYGSAGSGSEFGSDYTAEGVRRAKGSTPEERFSFGDLTFDIDAAKELCGGQPNDEVEVNPNWSYKINVDKVAAMNSKSQNPVLIAQIPTTRGLLPLLIDGHHRMYKACMEGGDTLPAYVLTPEETLFLCDTHPDLMTTMSKNLRDLTDKKAVEKSGGELDLLSKVARVWSEIISKAQPGGSDVHVPTAGDDSKPPKPKKKPAMVGEAQEVAAPSQTVESDESTPGWQPPPENNQRVGLVSMELEGVEKSQSGIMVCLYLPADIARQIALPDGEPIEDLHLTLAYIPGVGADQTVFDSVVRCLQESVGKGFAPVGGCIGGTGLFVASEGSDGKDVYYASFNSPVLPALLSAVRSALDWGGVSYAMNHGFTPHVTLKYVDAGSGALGTVKTGEFRIPAISVASRSIPRFDIPLTGTRIMKSKRGTNDVEVAISKLYGQQQIAYGVVLEPDTEDAQGDVMSAEDIEKTAHEYMERYRKVGKRHKGIIEDAVPVESYIAPTDIHFEDGMYGPTTVKKGSWVLGVKVLDPDQWAKVASGEYKAFSVGGTGIRD